MNIETLEQLRAFYAAPKERALRKQLSALDEHWERHACPAIPRSVLLRADRLIE